MDAFTANTLINSGLSIEEMVSIRSELKGDGPHPILLEKENELIGLPVSIAGTDYTGTILSINKSEYGFYPGSRYPFYVLIDEGHGQASGNVYEYELDQVIFMEN